MSGGAHVEMSWAGVDGGVDGGATSAVREGTRGAGSSGDAGSGAYLSDEEILGIEPVGQVERKNSSGGDRAADDSHLVNNGDDAAGTFKHSESAHGDSGREQSRHGDSRQGDSRQGDSARDGSGRADQGAGLSAAAEMPAWMLALAADPKVGAEAEALWSEHQAFRAAFATPDEARAVADDARAMKEIFPGGAQEARALKQGNESLREAAQSIDRIDAAIFSGDVRAQSEVVAELARANPVAFRSLVAEATKVLSSLPGGAPAVSGHFSRMVEGNGDRSQNQNRNQNINQSENPALRNSGEGWGTQNRNQNQVQDQNRLSAAGPQTPITNRELQVTTSSPEFDSAAYASFERSTNDAVARDVRGSIDDTLTRVLPEGVADGAAKRIGNDIFNEVHRALAGDRTLSEQVAEVLRDRRFGMAEQQRVAALLAGRAKQIVPGIARRVIGEWTSSVLGTARSKAARQAAAASRVDIAAPGGSLDSMPLRALSSREVNYASMSDDEILGL